MRGLVAGCAAALVMWAWAAPAAPDAPAAPAAPAAPDASAAEEHCPGRHGGTAVLDWGFNASEQIGAGFSSNYENSPQTVLGLTGVTQVEAGFKFGLALLSSCTLESWGTGNKGQLGNGNQLLESHPVPVQALTEVKEIAVGNAHAMALRYDGTVWTWGASEFGERGNKEKGYERTSRQTEPWFEPRDKPIEVPGLSGVKQIASGGKRDYALLSDGEVMAWGEDRSDELGVEEKGAEEELCLGETHAITPIQCSTIPRPVKIKGLGKLSGIERIGAGEESAYAIASGGKRVAAWGSGGKGQLGDGDNQDSSSPVRTLLEPASPVVEIVGGATHVLARLADGELYAWGSDGSGQLGFEAGNEPDEQCGRDACVMVPEPVPSLEHVVALAAGEGTSFAVEEEESAAKVIYSFGGNGPWELLGLGDVNLTGTSTPTPIPGLGSVDAVAASSTTAVATLEGASGRVPPIALTSFEEALTPEWDVGVEPYKLRDRPVGTREFGPTLEGSCKSPCSLPLSGLKAQPYEVVLKNPEAKEGKEKVRRIIGTPKSGKGWPSNTAPPTITASPAIETGKLRKGQTLTVSKGSWTNSPTQFSYQWLRCEGNGEAGAAEELGTECEPVGKEPATNEYEVQTGDVAHTIVAAVEAGNASGSSIAVTRPEVILAAGEEDEPPYPTFTQRPTITGAAVEGDTLTVHEGSWENSPTSFEEKWFRCKGRTEEGVGGSCGAITVKKGGEPYTGETYVPGAEDVGQWIEVHERATNPGGWEVASSLAEQIATPTPPGNVSPPTITGAVEQGYTLTASEGSWTNAPSNPHWQWMRCSALGQECANISKGTKQKLNITPKDVGHTLVVAESVENGFARSEAVDSSPTVVVPVPPPEPPSTQSPPTITGTDEQSHTLIGHAALWSGEPKSFEYQWKRCESGSLNCHPIDGAEGTKYTLTGTDVGKVIELRETATNGAGSGVSISAATATIAPALPVNSQPPSISGAPEQGKGLRELHGKWSNEPTEYSYQWEHCDSSGNTCEAISGATSRNYAPKSTEVGATLRVQERAINAAGTTPPATSAATAQVVSAPPANIKPPTVTGNPQQSETLTAHAGTWKNSPTHRSYQWLRCEPGECRTIEGATKTTYLVTLADVGFSLLVREAASNNSGWEAARSEGLQVGGTPTPFVTSLEPDTGSVDGGTSVLVIGGNLGDASAVSFGSTSASSYEMLSSSEIRAVAPAQGNGTVAVTVTTPKGTSGVTAGSQFTYGTPPTLTSIDPDEGPEGGGSVVMITGTQLEQASEVKFGAVPAEGFGVQSSTTIIAVAPPGTGTVAVTVKTPFGQTTPGSASQFTYVETGIPPEIKKLSVKKGPASGGTELTITGSFFTYTSAVSFGQVPAASFKVVSQNEISAVTPPNTAGLMDVTVTSPYGTSAMSGKDRFRYENPIITSVFPEEGPLAGGTDVTITGIGFAPGEEVTTFKFKREPATFVECPSTTECTMIAPPDTKAQTVKIKATANGRNSAAKDIGDEYTYVE
ncbi:MAG TPA: IPT/TIG domain-containing protein [Solirubrobacteraceae bacterium]|nr:IPT/TIG domain-containing protein [Solirubrobacteraceae bacterium]